MLKITGLAVAFAAAALTTPATADNATLRTAPAVKALQVAELAGQAGYLRPKPRPVATERVIRPMPRSSARGATTLALR